jgi:hypothetical protein
MRVLLLTFVFTGLSFSAIHAAPPIKPEQLDKLHALIKPQTNEEKFMQIPWLTDLWEARKLAAAEGKPILLWEMNGHPLACV